MREAERIGMGGVYEPPPELLPVVAAAVHCWKFCDGWQPTVLPLYHALHGIDDWELLTTLLAAIRDAVNKR